MSEPRETLPKLFYRYDECVEVFWINPWDGKEERLFMMMWPGHPIEETAKVERWFEEYAKRFCSESPQVVPSVVSDEDIQKAIALKTPFDDTNTFGHEMWATGFELGVIWLDEWLYNAGIRPETQTKADKLTAEVESKSGAELLRELEIGPVALRDRKMIDLAARIAELESENARLKAERERCASSHRMCQSCGALIMKV